MFSETHHTPFGWLTVHANHNGVTFLDWDITGQDDDSNANDVSRETWKQIHQYCDGKRQHFDIRLTLMKAQPCGNGLTSCAAFPLAKR